MKLTIIGSGTGSPNPDRAAACILVETGLRQILLDCGPAAWNRLTGRGVGAGSLDAVLISHFHLDHTLDLWPLFFAAAAPGLDRREPIRVLAPTGFNRFYEHFRSAYGEHVEPPEEAVRILEVAPSGDPAPVRPTCFPEMEITSVGTLHRPESVAYRLEAEGLSLVYSGDTGWSEGLIGLAREADWLILEATRPDDLPVRGHLTPSQAGRLADQAGAGNLILTHLSAKHGTPDPASVAARHFPGPVVTARDFLSLDLR